MRDVDCETAALIDALRASPRHGSFIRAVDDQRNGGDVALRGLRVLLVPGILYRDHPETGADGRVLRDAAARLGMPLEVFPAEQTGRLEPNTRQLLDWLEARRRLAPTVLVSLSKGSTEVWQALRSARAASAFAAVDAWVSVSGIPLGTPVLDHITSNWLRHAALRLVCRWKGWAPGFLVDYRRGAAPPASIPVPEHLRIAHVSGFPQRSDFRDRRARRLHRRLSGAGPNDGFARLGELCALPGAVYPVVGADHYLSEVADLEDLIVRVLQVVSADRTVTRAARAFARC